MSETCDPPGHDLRWLMLSLVATGTFMSTLDASIMNVALPTLTTGFRTTDAVTQWFVIIYTLVITILLMTFGKLGDLKGRRRLYVTGILVFTAGSLGCGLSISASMMIVCRAIQGIGSAMTMSAGPAMVTEGFPARERGKALGFIGSAVAIGLLAGPMFGGLIVQYAGWRWMFFINIPVGIVLTTLLTTKVQGYDINRGGRLDVRGAVLMGLTVALLVLGLTFGNRLGWGSPATMLLFAGAILVGVLFMIAETRSESPMLNFSLFRSREFSIGAFAGWANYAAMMPVAVFTPFYLQNLLGYDPQHVGLILASGPVTLAFVAPFSGWLSDRIGYRALTAGGLAVAGVALLWMRSLAPDSTWLDVVPRLVLASFGSGMFVSPNSSAVMGSVNCENLGLAAGTIALVRNLGMVCGVALAGAIIETAREGYLVADKIPPAAVEHHAFLHGLKAALLACAIISFIGASASTMRVRRERDVA